MTRKSLLLALTLLAALATGLSACGRKGPLERPPGTAAAPTPEQTSDATVRGPDKPFILDGLLL